MQVFDADYPGGHLYYLFILICTRVGLESTKHAGCTIHIEVDQMTCVAGHEYASSSLTQLRSDHNCFVLRYNTQLNLEGTPPTMAAYFFASPIDVDIKLEGEEPRKQVEMKGEKEKTISCPVYYDGDSVGGQVRLYHLPDYIGVRGLIFVHE